MAHHNASWALKWSSFREKVLSSARNKAIGVTAIRKANVTPNKVKVMLDARGGPAAPFAGAIMERLLKQRSFNKIETLMINSNIDGNQNDETVSIGPHNFCICDPLVPLES